MTRSFVRPRRAGLLSATLLVGLVACGGSGGTTDDGDTDGDGCSTPPCDDEAPGDAIAGTLGEFCSADADCPAGLRCLTNGIAGNDKFCANSCSTSADCTDFEATSYVLGVPAAFTPLAGEPTANMWGTETLSRGVGCVPADDGSGPTFCRFACGEFMALAFDAAGQASGCACLPGYEFNADQTACSPQPRDEGSCTVFSWASAQQRTELQEKHGLTVDEPLCGACNSDLSVADQLNCHTSRFGCNLRSTSLEGICTEFMTYDELMSCLNAATYTNCDCQCPSPEACTADASDCACCTCTSASSPPPRPTCNDPGGGSGGSTGSGGSSSGGSGSGGGGAPPSGGSTGSGGGGAPPSGGSVSN